MNIHADLLAMLAVAERKGVDAKKLARLRDGNRREWGHLVYAVAYSNDCASYYYGNAAFRWEEISPEERQTARELNMVLYFFNSSAMRQLMDYRKDGVA